MSENTNLEKVDALLAEAAAILEAIVNDRQEAFEEKSERWQESDKGGEHQERTDSIQAALDEVEGARASIAELFTLP